MIRPATREDIDAYSSSTNKPTTKAWVGEVDGRIIGLGGLALSSLGRWCAFLDIDPEARAYKMTLMRMAKATMAEASRMGIRYVYTEMSAVEPRAEAWLLSLGFEVFDPTRRIYRWSAKRAWQN